MPCFYEIDSLVQVAEGMVSLGFVQNGLENAN